MGDVLINTNPKFDIGTANSFTHSQKLDEGFILLGKGEDGEVRKELSILLLDPINNQNYNYTFSSLDGRSFSLKGKLESVEYTKKYGDYYEFLGT